MRISPIVTLLGALALGICGLTVAVALPGGVRAEDEAPEKHLDPLETIARFLKLVDGGKAGDIKLAAKLIDPDRADQAWANDQLDSSSRDLLMSMRVYNFASVFSKDPVVGQPTYALSRFGPGQGPAAGTPAAATPAPAAPPTPLPMVTGPASAGSPAPAPAPPEISEAAADRATVTLASGRTIAMVKNAAGAWQLVEYSSSLAARADWAATRDRDLDLPPAGRFQDFYFDMAKHDADYAWRVIMALGEAGRFADLARLIDLPEDAGPAVPVATPAGPADPKAIREHEAFLEEQGRLLYSWLRHSMPQRVRKVASGIPRPESIPAGSDLPEVQGQVANFAIWTDDRKRVVLTAHLRETPDTSLGLGAPVFEWRFNSACYSAETKRNWIHAQRQPLPEQP